MQPYFTSNGLVTKALEHAFKLEHIMDLTRLRCLGSLFSMLHQACRNVAQYNANHPDFPMQIEQLERYIQVRAGPGNFVCCLLGKGQAFVGRQGLRVTEGTHCPRRVRPNPAVSLPFGSDFIKIEFHLSIALSGLRHPLVLIWRQPAEDESRAGRVHPEDHHCAAAHCAQRPHH